VSRLWSLIVRQAPNKMISRGRTRRIGSGTVLALGLSGVAVALLALGRVLGWDPTWRAFGVTPLRPPFFDMHVINDYAACASKGIDAYAPHACNVDNFNIPPAWLWLGFLGLDGSHSSWLSGAVIAAAAIVMILLLQGRSWYHGVIALGAMISPSVMMGVERGNLDLLILALVGSAALIYEERRLGRLCAALAFMGVGIALKLFPMFCVSLAARFNKHTLIFASAIAASSLIYLALIMKYVFLIKLNVPSTFILSYGYKPIFFGLEHIRSEAGLSSVGLADSFLPASIVAAVLFCATAVAVNGFHNRRVLCPVHRSVAGTAFLFGAGVYCGTYLLGSNFIYRLMFLLLCLPQLLDWQIRRHEGNESANMIELSLFGSVFGVLWLNGNANGHSIFLLLPQLLDWLLFFGLAAVLILNFLRTSVDHGIADLRRLSRT
jgi:hypothetical protein